MKIIVNGLTPINGEGNLRAFADINVGDIRIRSVRIIKEEDKKLWVSLPQQQGANGSWYPIVKCEDPRLLSEIKEKVLAEWLKTQEDKSDEISRV